MNLKNRIKKLEQTAGVDDGFCPCGTPYYLTIVIGDGEHPDNICPKCKLDIRPPTAKDFENGRVRILEPRTNFTREEFEDHQNRYTMSAHITYEQYLSEQTSEAE